MVRILFRSSSLCWRVSHVYSRKTSSFVGNRLISRWYQSSSASTACSGTNGCYPIFSSNKQYLNQCFLIFHHQFASIPPSRSSGQPSGSPISWLTVGVTIVLGSVMVFFLKRVSSEKEKEFEQNMIRSYGRPELGGDFELVDHNGLVKSNRDFLGKWVLIYFGFTNCPDICPEELEKMGYVIDNVNRIYKSKVIHPVFISIDPERDTPAAVKKYIAVSYF